MAPKQQPSSFLSQISNGSLLTHDPREDIELITTRQRLISLRQYFSGVFELYRQLPRSFVMVLM